MVRLRHTDIVCCGKAHYGIIETYKPGVVNLELEVLKMKIIIIFIDLLMATVLFLLEDFLSNQGIQKEVCCFYQEIILD